MEVACEALESKPSSQAGWLEWGQVNESGDWVGLYGLKDSLNAQESMYYLDAAGVCEAVGQSGKPAIEKVPQPAFNDGPSMAAVEAQPSAVADEQPVANDPVPWGLLPVALIVLAIIAWKRGWKMVPSNFNLNRGPVQGKEQEYPNVFRGNDDEF